MYDILETNHQEQATATKKHHNLDLLKVVGQKI